MARADGVTVIGGLIVSTILTLVIVPATFSLAMGVEQRVGPWLSYWLTTGGESGTVKRPPRLFAGGFRRRNRPPATIIEPAE